MIIRKTLREQVVEILRHKILSGEIKPGERIIEAKVAEELKVSRGPGRLKKKGWLYMKHRKAA